MEWSKSIWVCQVAPVSVQLIREGRPLAARVVSDSSADTDMQYAYTEGIRDYMLSKKAYVGTQVGYVTLPFKVTFWTKMLTRLEEP